MGCVPNDFETHIKICVNQAITHTCNQVPGNVGILSASFFTNHACSFTQNLELAQYSTLHQIIHLEFCLGQAIEKTNDLTCCQ